ncbi:hypothetical protein ACH4TP_38170 [Streptomyces sp. NPDC021012]|uniref:hypothetical protein n=1 Tax=Streptomyces sp. NPDC021012 TaxID=3365107 RepID=UPI0037AACDFD
MSSYPERHKPGEMAPIPPRTQPVPPLDEDGLGGVLEDTAGFHPGVDMIRDGIRLLALDRLTVEDTKNVLAALAGFEQSVVTAIGFLVERLTNPDTNPALDVLDAETAKRVQTYGEQYRYELAEFGPRQHAAEAIGLIDGI